MTNINPDGEYGIVANVLEPDKIFRQGAKSWLAGGTGGEGWYRFEWLALNRPGRVVRKWAPTFRFDNFRAAWIPKHLDEYIDFIRGTREKMEKVAADMNAFAAEERAKKLLRAE